MKQAVQTFAQNIESADVSLTWLSTVFSSFLHDLAGNADDLDVRLAAAAALQDLAGPQSDGAESGQVLDRLEQTG